MDRVRQETLLKEYYWELVKWDGEKIQVRPKNVEMVQKKLDAGEGFIKTKTRSIAVKDIKDFVQTDKVYTEQKLLEAGARAFNEPIYEERTSQWGHKEIVVLAKWVKKVVTRRRWDSYYSAGTYRKLYEEDNQVIIAFRLPVHEINPELVEECTPSEIARLGL